jgi:hypothetical protein
LALVSCQNAYLENEVQPTASQSGYNSAEQQAIQLASSAASVFFDQSRSIRTITAANAVTPVYSTSSSRTEGENPTIYAVDYDDNQGFAIISAQNIDNKLLGVFESGTYEDAMENPEFEYYVESAVDYVNANSLSVDSIRIKDTYVQPDFSKSIGPLLEVQWGQDYPYGMYCTNKISGCTNTAMAQIMSYYKYPTTLELTYAGAESDSITLDWDEILKHKKSNSKYDETDLSCCDSENVHTMIASLLRELGTRAGSIYNNNSTSTYRYNIPSTLKSFGYEVSSLKEYTTGIEYDELSKGLLIVCGRRYDGSGYHGHAWVVDGYRFTYVFTRKETPDGVVYEKSTNPHYAHVNWGWDGVSNGYYLSNVFDTSNPYSLDDKTSNPTMSYNYNTDVQYFVVSR